jgi:hypothetical protein
MILFFKELGERIEAAWKASSYSEAHFPSLALDALSRNPPFPSINVADIADWLFLPSHEFLQPYQGGRLFGEPPIVLFQAPRFYIEALFWYSGTTDIHEHAFSGAFTVLAGSSVHSHWRFTRERVVNSRMHWGKLERVSTEILRPGDMRPISAGEELIHQLFHLEVPSVTIVVRTYLNRDALPQRKFLLPGLALDTESIGSLLTRRLLLLTGISTKGHQLDLGKYAAALIQSSDLEALYYTLALLQKRQLPLDLRQNLHDLARQVHGDQAVDLFQKVCEGEKRIRAIVALRARVIDPTARFLLALLMLMPDRKSIFEAIQLDSPGTDPYSFIEGCLERTSGQIPGLELTDVNRVVLRALLEGLDFPQVLDRLRETFSRESVDAQADEILRRCQHLVRSDLLYSLFADSPLHRATAG